MTVEKRKYMNINAMTNYELIQQKELKDLKSEGYLLRHKKSGARVLLMENDDENKVFTIGFRTPPEDSTGLPHILEHSVLCGSKNFPVKDPFVELVKGSLNTFLNAMTYPDKTVYPVASCNEKDFQNLMHVYMDAVFYPNIYEHDEIFRQEGWSYNLESKEDALTYNGVVYNEMKGAFSSPEGVLDRVILNSLFPDTSYANESGGDPEVIPELTYEQFLEFHSRYYHPSNSYIYLYGDMDMEEKLEWLDREYLSKFDTLQIDSAIREQAPFDAVKEIEMEYSIASDESEEDNTYLSYNKVIGTSLDRELYLAFQVLDYALLSAPGAPLKKALVDTGIDALTWAKKVEELGAGEILLTSMDCDGTKAGYDIPLTRAVSDAVSIPVIASGGAGKMEHFKEALTDGMADAALAASLFHYKELEIGQVKEYLQKEGVAVRWQ